MHDYVQMDVCMAMYMWLFMHDLCIYGYVCMAMYAWLCRAM